jgi:hypothetical protein
MRMPDPSLSVVPAPTQLSRKCAACEEEEKAKMLQTRPAGSVEPAPSGAPPIVHEVLRSPGQPLDMATRAYMEPRFGHDFSHVRVHTDESAAASAQAVNALALLRPMLRSMHGWVPPSRWGPTMLPPVPPGWARRMIG